jgi:hypothetical protein
MNKKNTDEIKVKVVIGDFNLGNGKSLGAGLCTAYFDVVCQENSTRTAFSNRRDPDEYVFLNDKLYKFKLASSDGCFKSTKGIGASKWFYPEVTTEGEGYYMVGGNSTPVVGGDEGDAAGLVDGWVMEAHIGKANTSCFPYQGAPDACTANRVCTCAGAPWEKERVVKFEDRTIRKDTKEDVLLCCDTPKKDARDGSIYDEYGKPTTSGKALTYADLKRFDAKDTDKFYKSSCKRDNVVAACQCSSSVRKCAIDVPHPTPTLSLKVPPEYLSSSFWKTGDHIMRLFAFSLKRRGAPNPNCPTLRNYYYKNPPSVNAYDVSQETAGQCMSKAYDCSAGPKYKCDSTLFKCVQDESGTYNLESTCAMTCFDPNVFKDYQASDPVSTSNGGSTATTTAPPPTEYRYECDAVKFQCTLRQSPDDFAIGTPLAGNQYVDGTKCNKACAPQVKYECGGPPSYKCTKSEFGDFESTAACEIDCHASGDAGCEFAGGFCSTDNGAPGICTTMVGPCVEIKSEAESSGFATTTTAATTAPTAATAPPTASNCKRAGQWCRTDTNAEGSCTMAGPTGAQTLECKKDATAVPVSLQVNGALTLSGVAVDTAADKAVVEKGIMDAAGADAGKFSYTVKESTRRRQLLAAASTSIKYTLSFTTEDAAEETRVKMKDTTTKIFAKAVVADIKAMAPAKFNGLQEATVNRVQDSPRSNCESQGKEWFLSMCLDATTCNVYSAGCCPDGVTEMRDAAGSNCKESDKMKCEGKGDTWDDTAKTCSPYDPSACTSAAPFKCADGTCMIAAGDCPMTGGGDTACPTPTPFRCADGGCKVSSADCATTSGGSGTTTGCPAATPYACSDGSSCMMKEEECPGYQAPTSGGGSPGTDTSCPTPTPFKCADGGCKVSSADCTTTSGGSGTTKTCPPSTPYACSDGSCMMKEEECPDYQATGSTTTMTPQEKCDQKGGCWNQAKGSCNTYTTFGCCPGTTVPQNDEWGMNCPPECDAGEKWDESKYRCVASVGAHWSWLNCERLH